MELAATSIEGPRHGQEGTSDLRREELRVSRGASLAPEELAWPDPDDLARQHSRQSPHLALGVVWALLGQRRLHSPPWS